MNQLKDSFDQPVQISANGHVLAEVVKASKWEYVIKSMPRYDLQEFLDKLGNEGWELVCRVPVPYEPYTNLGNLVFKRVKETV